MSAVWTEERYGIHVLNLGLFTISVFWGTTKNAAGKNGYVWRASTGTGSAADVRFETLDEAKARAVRWARKALARATDLCPLPAASKETPNAR